MLSREQAIDESVRRVNNICPSFLPTFCAYEPMRFCGCADCLTFISWVRREFNRIMLAKEIP